MNELLQKHGCSNVFTIPEGLRELMADISREVLREQPTKIFDFIANYLSALLITREHGLLAVKILDDLCDCRPSVSEHLMHLGLDKHDAKTLSQVIKEEIEEVEPATGREIVKEMEIVKKILNIMPALDEEATAKVCQIARNAYRDYSYRKKILEKRLKTDPEEPWEIAACHTLEIYKSTKPSFSELTRAAQKIQAAYRGYHVRRHMLRHLKPDAKKQKPKVELPGPPIDIAGSREIELGPVLSITPREDNVEAMFTHHTGDQLGLKYDPAKTITHVQNFQMMADTNTFPSTPRDTRTPSRKSSIKMQTQFPKIARESMMVSSMVSMQTTSPMPFQDHRYSTAPTKMPGLTEDEMYVASEVPKISFAQTADVISDDTDAVDMIQELLAVEQEDDDGAPEVPEDIRGQYSEDDADSVVEDIVKAADEE